MLPLSSPTMGVQNAKWPKWIHRVKNQRFYFSVTDNIWCRVSSSTYISGQNWSILQRGLSAIDQLLVSSPDGKCPQSSSVRAIVCVTGCAHHTKCTDINQSIQWDSELKGSTSVECDTYETIWPFCAAQTQTYLYICTAIASQSHWTRSVGSWTYLSLQC